MTNLTRRFFFRRMTTGLEEAQPLRAWAILLAFLVTSSLFAAKPKPSNHLDGGAILAVDPAQIPTTVEAARRDLDSSDPKVRLSAILAIGKLGVAALPDAKKLSVLLDDESVIARPGPISHAAHIDPADTHLDLAAQRMLISLGEKTAPLLIEVLNSGPAHARLRAAETLAALGKKFDDTWIALLMDKETPVAIRKIAAEQLAHSRGKEVEKALDAALADPDATVRLAAVQSLGGGPLTNLLHPPAADSIPATKESVDALVAALHGRGPLAHAAQTALAIVGAPAVPALLAELEKGNVEAQQDVGFVFACVSDPAAVDLFIQASNSRNPAVRAAVVPGLTNSRDARAAEQAVALMDDPDLGVRRAVYQGLYGMTIASEETQQELCSKARLALQNDPNVEIRGHAALNLWRTVDRDKNIAALTEAFHDKQPHVRASAAEAFAQLAPDGVVESLVALLSDETPDVRRAAIEGLGHLHAVAQPAVPALVKMLNEPEDYLRRHAANALADIGDPRAVEPLITAFESAITQFRKNGPDANNALDNSHHFEQALRRFTNINTITSSDAPAAWRQWLKEHPVAAQTPPREK